LPEELLSFLTGQISFQIILTHKYPRSTPQIVCLTPFIPKVISLCDGRDLFDEVVGKGGWKDNYPIYFLCFLLFDFV